MIAIILFLTSMGAAAPVAASATFAVAAIMFIGGVYTKFLAR